MLAPLTQDVRHGAAKVYVPAVPGIDWAAVARDSSVPLIITNCRATALRLCQSGQPAVAVIGVNKARIARWFRRHGARVLERHEMQ